MDCYHLEKYTYNNPIFKKVEATYIIHLEGNGRLESIQQQLDKYHPTQTVYILFNKGFKKCKKDTSINKPSQDLTDAFFYCFKDAKSKNYENILILEDDFLFDEKILDKKHPESIEKFLQERKGQNFIYYLGCLPFIQFSTYVDHNRVFFSGGTHSCIYPYVFFNHILENVDQKSLIDWDAYTNYYTTQYKYYTSLCYQLFPETENQKNWGNNWVEHMISSYVLIYFIKLLKLDIQVKPGYDIFEFISTFIVWFIVVTQIILNILVFLSVKTNYKWLNKNWHYYIYLFMGANIVYPIFIIFVYIITIYISVYYYS